MLLIRALRGLLFLSLVGITLFLAYAVTRGRPEDLPWTAFDLSRPIGLSTGGKVASLADRLPACAAQLDRAGVAYRALPPLDGGPSCGYADGIALASASRRAGARRIVLNPAAPPMSCAVAAGLAMWEWHVVQPAALRHFGEQVTGIDHYGAYSCRRTYGAAAGRWSEHATADAFDVAGFRLADGRRVSVQNDWRGTAVRAAFLREVRDGACRLFSTVLSPDYNEAHSDHIHVDVAARGRLGGGYCR